MRNFLKKVFGSPESRALKGYEARLKRINDLAPKYQALSDTELRKTTGELKARLGKGETLDDVLYDAFAAVREAATRVLNQRHFDVQLIGGMALHEGNVAEMKTGEGKTLVATLAVYLNALAEQGVHVVTVNDYLAQRDAGWMGGIYHKLGLSTAVIISGNSLLYDPEFANDEHEDERFSHLKPISRQEAYQADITYGMNSEFGFDYLRDNMVRSSEQLRQRPLNYAIVDEVDSILIDEARTPLIISAPATNSASSYSLFAQIARRLDKADFAVDEKRNAANLTDVGVDKVQKMLGIDNLYASTNVQVIYHLEQAVRAQTLFKRDKDYVVTPEGEIIIVDEFTGRLLHGRRYNEGLHQAIEAKEGVEVKQESMTLATISYQNYFRLYTKLAGMTGTAKTEEEEFQQVYNLNVVEVPTNRPLARVDKPDRIYSAEKGKLSALVNDVKGYQDRGQPVLIGTVSIEKNELVSRLLSKAGVAHEVLNAKNHEREAAIIAKAGEKGSVTLATNIAGRGTDIKLGTGVRELGGLIVVGSERHEARRIDNQLRGRGGRQGDPGTTQFYVSAEDDLMRIFGGERIQNLMQRLGVDENTPIENKTLSKALENAQKKVESHYFDMRKNVVQYDDVMNRHRKSTYAQRQTILHADDIREHVVEAIVQAVTSATTAYQDQPEELKKELSALVPFDSKALKVITSATAEQRADVAQKLAVKLYDEREKQLGAEPLRLLEREVYLQVLDTAWMQHLENMEHFRQGVGLQGYGQRDPLVEYRRQGQAMFERMQADNAANITQIIFRAEPPKAEDQAVETELTKAAEHAVETSAEPQAKTKITRSSAGETKTTDTSRPAQTQPSKRASKAERKRKKKARRR